MLNADDESILDAALRRGRICPMPAKAASVRPANAKAAWQSGDGNQLQSGTG